MGAMTEFTITIDQVQDFEFRVKFDNPNHAELILDDGPPLGHDAGPSASRILAAAIGNCLSASLLMCARKSRVEMGLMKTRVTTRIDRSEKGRLRIRGVDVELDPSIAEADRDKARRCLSLFEDYCTVTQSVREGFPINVTVKV
jgi:uncharacterized OsmC-like protein